MPKPEWGVKRICPTTGKRFYDLNRSPIVSPYTGEIVTFDGPKTRGLITERTAAKGVARDLVDLEDDVILEDAAADVDLDDELLEADEDDNVSLDDLADVAGDEEEV
jgi:uncharacterized protein (TIGR02300 family)